jgi:hypothetical protein
MSRPVNKQADLPTGQVMPEIESHVYAISPKATSFEVQTLIEEKLLQLDAFLSMAYGETGASFRMQPESLQDQYLWGCSRMASEIRELYYALLTLR